MLRIFVSLFLALTLNFYAYGQSKSVARPNENSLPSPMAKSQIEPIPPELLRRSTALHSLLQPSAKTWIDEQAKIEAKRPSPNLDALRATIRQRFAISPPPAKSGRQQPAAALQSNNAVDEVAVMIILEMVQEGDRDLQAQMQNAYAMMQVKQALRNLLDQLDQQMAAGKTSPRNENCSTAFCRSIPTKLTELATASAQTPRPIHLQAPAITTYQQLSALQNQLQNALDSENEISEMGSMQLQMLMDARSKLLQMASDIEKANSDTANAITQNIKQ